jgi:hypothetical protein
MKNNLTIGDFILLKDSLDEYKLDKAIALYDEMQEFPDQWLINVPRFHKAIADLCTSMSMIGVGFNDEKHQYESIRSVVEICSDIVNNKNQYIIIK